MFLSRTRRTALTGLCAALLTGSAPVAVAGGPLVQAVVSYDGAAPAVAGVRVLGTLPALQVAVVQARPDGLARLSRARGVRGVALDRAMTFASKGDGGGDAVLAATGLGGAAGRAGAGAGVRVALVDTGVSDSAALDRASGRLVDAADTSTPGQVRTGGSYPDGFGHGTFMASVVAGGPTGGTRGKALGVAPGATVLNVRVATQDGTTSLSRVLGGLDWVAAHAGDVDVVNLALSQARPRDAYGPDPLTDAVEKVRDAGVTVVVAAGNTRDVVGDPGFDPRVLTVGAVDVTRGKVAKFSGSDTVHGVQKPDVVANGVDVLGVLPAGSVIAQAPGTVHLGNGLYRGSGTSQATAVASGLAAILLAAHPEATPTQVKASLRCAAGDLPGKKDGAGSVATTTSLCAGTDGQAYDGSGDATGEVGFDASTWAASTWAASTWAASTWAASTWAASTWAGDWGEGS